MLLRIFVVVKTLAQRIWLFVEHVRQIKNKEIYAHYLSHTIQTEMGEMLAREIKVMIIKKINDSKYFSIIIYCTLDISH